MKTILLATDYSTEANNALRYAIKLAEFTKARLVLFHAYHMPVPVTDVPAVIPVAVDELQRENEAAMKKMQDKAMKLSYGKIKVESRVGFGMPVEEILNTIKKVKADLVLLGMKGAGKLDETIIGSTTTSLMQKTKVPVLVVPAKSKFHENHKIVLAYDYQKAIGKNVLQTIIDFARLFRAEVEVVHVVKLDEEPHPSTANKMIKLRAALRGIKHHFYFPVSENITEELSSFVRRQKAGILVMLPHKHAMLEKLFNKGNTRRMAFHTNVPLLSLHD